MLKTTSLWSLAIVAMGWPLAPAPAAAQEAWTITATPYLWLQGMTGDLKVRGNSVHVNDNFFDVLSKNDTVIGGFLHVDARQTSGPWGFYVEGNYSYASAKDNIGPINTRVRTGMAILEAGGMVRLVEGPVGAWGTSERWRIEAVAGLRYLSLDAKVDIGPLAIQRTLSWTDPLVGVNGYIDLSPSWALIAHGDVGGFGVGSEFSTNLYALVGYRSTLFGANVLSSFGYRGLYINKKNSSSNSSADLWLHGPVLGMTFRF
jgi:hypothetical protein